MEYKLIKESVTEIVSYNEKKKFEDYLDMLKSSEFKFPIQLKDFFDLYIYNVIIEEKLKEGLFELRFDMEMGGKTTNNMLRMQKNVLAKQIYLNAELKTALQSEVRNQGLTYDVENKIKDLISILKIEKKANGKQTRKLLEATKMKNDIFNEINDMINGQEPIE